MTNLVDHNYYLGRLYLGVYTCVCWKSRFSRCSWKWKKKSYL